MKNQIKSSYSVHHQVESFFTGSQIQFESEGEHFYCANGSVLNKISVSDGQIKAQITSNNEDDTIIRFILSADDTLIVIAYNSGLITKFNLTDDTIEREFKSLHTAPIAYLKINHSCTILATGSSDGCVKLWNLKNHYCSHNLKGLNGVISCIEFHQDEELIFCAAGDDNIHIFDINSSQRITKLTTHCTTITDMRISSDGKLLISVGRDKIAVVWNIADREEKKLYGSSLRTIPLYEAIESLVIIDKENLTDILGEHVSDTNREFFATIGEEGLIKIWDTETGSKVFSQNEPPLSDDRSPGSQCFQLCVRPNHNQLCAVSYERDLFFYKLPKLELIQQLQGHIDEILSACWFAKNKYLAIACNSPDLKIMELENSNTQLLKGHTDMILCVKSVPTDSMILITSSKDCSILIWKFHHETMVATIVYKATGHTHAIHSLGILNDERVFYSAGEDTTLKKWSFSDSKKEMKNRITNEVVEDGIQTLIANQTIKAHDDRIDEIAISPNDQLVATGSRDKTARVFSATGLQILATLRGHRRGIHALQFSPVDQVIVTAGDSTLRMWNLQDFTCVKTFQGHECSVLNFSFLSSGLQIISAGSDGNMKLWDCKTNECSKTIDAHDGNIWAFSLTADDSMLISGGQDEKLTIWRDTTKEEQEENLTNLQSMIAEEQDFANYINKKKWRKALKMALRMENQAKILNVIREILLESDGATELENILMKCPIDQLNFIVECCLLWNSSAKNSAIAQQVFNIIIRRLDTEQLLKMPTLISSIKQLRNLTEKSFNRYERLVQEATFVDFFLNSFRVQ